VSAKAGHNCEERRELRSRARFLGEVEMELAPGTRLGGYVITGVLGRGGMGVVYQAVDERLGRPVAIKLIAAQQLEDPRSSGRFKREATAVAAISHANVARVYDLGTAPGGHFIVLELLTGGTLKERVKRGGRLPWREVAELGARVAEGLAAIHGAGLVHRDLKPENVLLDPSGVPKITDFGLVRRTTAGASVMTKTGEMLGTLEYMSPEQADTGRVDERADLYSFGATLYYLLAGRPPFEGQGYALIAKHLREVPRPIRAEVPEVPASLERLVLGLLEKDPAKRPGPAAAVARQLAAITGEDKEPSKGGRRVPWVFLAIVGAFVAGGAVALLAWPREKPPEPPVTKPEPPRPDPPKPVAKEPFLDNFKGFRKNGALELVSTFGGYEWKHPGEVWDVALSADGQCALTADERGLLHLWEIPSGRELWCRDGLRGAFSKVAISPDGKFALTCDGGEGDGGNPNDHAVHRDSALRLWDLARGECLAEEPHAHSNWTGRVAFSPNGELALTTSAREYTVKIWKIQGGKISGPTTLEGHTAPVKGAVFFPDGRRVLSGSEDGTVGIWDLETTKRIDTIKTGDVVDAVDVSDDGHWAISAGRPTERDVYSVTLWSLDERREVKRVPTGDSWVTSVVFLPGTHSRALFTTHTPQDLVGLLDLEAGRVTQKMLHTHAVYRVVPTPDGMHALSAAGDTRLGYWDLERRALLHPDDGPFNAGLALAIRDRRLASGGRDMRARAWDVDAPVQPGEAPPRVFPVLELSAQWWVNAVAISPDGNEVFGGDNAGFLSRWNARTGEQLSQARTWTGSKPKPCTCAAYDPDGKVVFAGLETGEVVRFDRERPADVVALPGRHGDRVRALGFFGGQGDFVSVGADGSVFRWRFEPMRGDARNVDSRRFAAKVAAASIGRDGRVLAGLEGGRVVVMDLTKNGEVVDLARAQENASCVALNPASDLALVGEEKGRLRLLGLASRGVVADLDLTTAADWANAAVFSDDGGSLFVNTNRGVILRFKVSASPR
jgi:serine/threonine-protein kinase